MRAIVYVVAGALVMGAASSARAQDGLTPVRELYESASYEAALAALDSMSAAAGPPAIEAEQYRVFCLVALGRSSEAERVIERIVSADPTFQLAEAETSPRILETFETVRRRALPAVVSELYDEGKAAFDRRQFAEAERALASAVTLIDTPEVVNRPGMDDLRRLASGFLSLSRAELAAEERASRPLEARATIADPTSTAAAPSATEHWDLQAERQDWQTERQDLQTERRDLQAERRDFSPGVPAVPDTEPVAIRQDLPPWTNPAADFSVVYRGAIVVTIDEAGDVTRAEIAESIYPLYNQELMRYARRWKYEPARRGGRPIQSQKRVEVELRPR
jgi:TonB family protein